MEIILNLPLLAPKIRTSLVASPRGITAMLSILQCYHIGHMSNIVILLVFMKRIEYIIYGNVEHKNLCTTSLASAKKTRFPLHFLYISAFKIICKIICIL